MLCDKLADNLLEIFIPEYDNTNIDKYIKYIKDISYEYYSQYKLNHHITIYDNVNKQYIYIWKLLNFRKKKQVEKFYDSQ